MPNQYFNAAKHGMTRCSHCHSSGYMHNPEKYPCPICRGFGYLRDGSIQFKSIKSKPGPSAINPTR
jgi:DnaJ-class molecular chaperone